MDSWNEIAEKVHKLNDFNPKVREFKRLYLNGATLVDVDTAGRVNVPKQLLEHAGIKKEIVFTAQGSKVELWDKDTYYEYIRSRSQNFSDLAEEVAGSGFINPFESL